VRSFIGLLPLAARELVIEDPPPLDEVGGGSACRARAWHAAVGADHENRTAGSQALSARSAPKWFAMNSTHGELP